MKFNLWLATPFCLFVAPLSAQTIRYVNHNASGSADGSSWANAFIRVQQALAVAQDGDEIWIAKGTYKPTTTNDRYARYDLPSGVAVYGGFAGTETQREQRDWTANLTILSGDIGVPGDSTDNSFNVLYAYSPNDKTRLDGLVFEEGNATNDDINIDYHRPTRSGGGIYLDGENFGYAQLSVVNCTIRRNRALYQGGGIYANGRSGGMAIIRLDNCLFEMNTSQTFGGGFSIENDFAQPFAFEAKGCTFTQNYCGWGAAMFLQCHQAVSFSKCAFNQNESVGGTTIHFEGTGYKDPISFTDCTFKNNTSGETIVWLLYAPEKRFPISISRCNFESNKGTPLAFFAPNGKYSLTVDHSKFLLNGNNQDGTGVYAASASLQETSAVFSNCLFYKGYAIEFSGKVDSVVNSILIADNFNHNIAYGASGIYLKNCLFSHLSCANLGSNVICGPTNLFGLDPLFVNPSASDFHLQACSPAINAGNNAILDSLGIKTDLDGNPRIRNGVSDLGPYETNVSLHPGVATEPACAGASDGAIVFNPDICLPFNFEWSNGTTTGNNTEGLSAGTYVFTAIGSNNIPVSDTLVIADPEPMVISTKVEDVLCYGEPGGYVETTVGGGTAPYTYMWEPPLPPLPSHYSKPAGSYFVTVTDANGCMGTAQASIGSPDPLQFFYTIQPVSCMLCSDGSVVFDSVIGGTNPPLPAPLYDLPSGVYSFTLTDAVGCKAVINFTITVMIDTEEAPLEDYLKISPNPTVSGENSLVEWLGNEPASLRVLDLQGKILQEKRLLENTPSILAAEWPSGIYQLEIQTVTGKRVVRRWVIL